MSILFTEFQLGGCRMKNRFAASACEDNLASDDGFVTESVIKKNRNLAKGEVGLIISSHMAVHPSGRTRKRQLIIYDNGAIAGLRDLVESVHDLGGKIVFQLGHAGLQTTAEAIGRVPMGPSTDPVIDSRAIRELIRAFHDAAERAMAAGADGVQLHAAHGYLINEFLSPFYNRRQDEWGGSEDNRFRFLKEIVAAVRTALPPKKPLLIKLNSNDFRQNGITPELAVRYARQLALMDIGGIEVSCGSSSSSPWMMCRGDVPVNELLRRFPESERPRMEEKLRASKDRFKLPTGTNEGYNLGATTLIRPEVGQTPLFAVGGWRHVPAMEQAVAQGFTDLISMCRPFIREPFLVRKLKRGEIQSATCVSCNKCLAATGNGMPVRCYYKKTSRS